MALYSQCEVVEAHSPQSERSGQKTDVCEEDADGLLKVGEFLEDGRRLDELTVRLRLLDLENKSGFSLSLHGTNSGN